MVMLIWGVVARRDILEKVAPELDLDGWQQWRAKKGVDRAL